MSRSNSALPYVVLTTATKDDAAEYLLRFWDDDGQAMYARTDISAAVRRP